MTTPLPSYEEASKAYPSAAEKIDTFHGKRRARERRRLRDKLAYDRLKQSGSKCSTCTSFIKHCTAVNGAICSRFSDFHGYQMAQPDGLCLEYQAVSKKRESSI